MLGKISTGRHLMVGVAIAVVAALAGFGVIGPRNEEHFDAKTVVIERQGDQALRITEYVDIDFAGDQRHGLLRRIPNDFGAATDVVASSPTAPADVSVVDLGGYTEIRVGDPNTTVTGRHRYVLSYTLPDARYAELGALNGDDRHLTVDLVSPPGGVYEGDPETTRFEVVVSGFVLSNTTCSVGALDASGGCELAAAGDGTYRAVVEPLEADAGFTVGGTIDGFTDTVAVPEPERPDPPAPGTNRGLIALGFAGLGTAAALGVWQWARRRGRNEVFAGGAADAAYGQLPAPGTGAALPPTRLVPDDQMGDLATTEFVPPKGLAPWQAHVLLTERCGDDAVQAWLSGLVGAEALAADEVGSNMSIGTGPAFARLAPVDQQMAGRILAISDPYVTGKYEPRFAAAWKQVHAYQADWIAQSGWWKRLPPGRGMSRGGAKVPFQLIMVVIFFIIWSGSMFTAFLGVFRSWPAAIALGLVFPALVAYFMYRVLLPARSARGSALALQTESFRRFLHASEAKHVEWAWSKGLLREYSAWAVALGEADAWSRALGNANVPAPARVGLPLIVYSHRSSMSSARTAPSSSGGRGFGGGGGGFSGGGGVGGGGGGGSSGSW